MLNSFLICHNLTAVGLEDASATTAQNTWHSYDFRCESWIDHICVSQSLKGMIEDFKIREGECVTSDHWPVEISVNISIATCDKKNCKPAGNKRLLW